MKFSKYHALWDEDYKDYPLRLELECIRLGGTWKNKAGEDCGLGMFEHMMNARALMWPKRYRHRWTDLLYHNFIENDITILMGCASSQKTSHAVEYVLIRYCSSPMNTLAVLSTVNMDKLDIGVYAELILLWDTARKLHPWIPGHIVGYKRAITTDDIDETDVRLFTRGIICRPCYVGGRNVGLGILAGVKQENLIYVCDELQFMSCFRGDTLVDTSLGQRRIDSINTGDLVLTASGENRVRAVSSQVSDSMVKIKTVDGREVICTPEHKFFTQKGWVKACNLTRLHYMMSGYETMCILQDSIQTCEQSKSLSEMQRRKDERGLHPMWKTVCQAQPKFDTEMLRAILCGEMEFEPARVSSEVLHQRKGCENISIENTLAQGQPRTLVGSHKENARLDSRTGGGESGEVQGGPYQDWLEASSSLREWYRANYHGIENFGDFSWERKQFRCAYENEEEQRLSQPLQNRRGIAGIEAGDRGGRGISQPDCKARTRREENQFSNGSWVDSCEVFKQEGIDGLPECEGGTKVYNLEVEGHPSYSVNGLIVHNCGFSGSWPHLFSNGNVKVIGSGNPKHDTEDELAISAEPKEGWGGHPEPTKTEVWETKFMGGKCVNLVGTDSPNFDVPEGEPEPFKKLIGRKFEQRMAHDHGRDSFEYYRLVKGVMKVGFAMSRVITRQLCREYNAQEGVVWKGDHQTRGYALDPSYGGEDRCVGMPWKFGEDADGNQKLLFMPYRVFKINLQSQLSVEDQIAEICEEELGIYDIPVENLFYDACGKGTIGAAFARRFGKRVPVAVDSGARPTKRPVRADLYVDEENGTRRHKRCEEHYSKFVSEMWFSWRYIIEADQLRGLEDDVMAEGCARIYYMVSGNRIEVEPKNDPKKKEDLKRRLGKSPDLGDVAAIACEGARQRGFVIGRLGEQVEASSKDDEDFFDTEAKEYAQAIQDKLLIRK